MITFNKKSWHYRMAKLGSSSWPSDSLCPYAREVMLGLFLFCLLTLISGWFVIWNIIGVILAFQGYWWDSDLNGPNVANIIFVSVVGGVGFKLALEYIRDKIALRQWKKEQIAKSKGIKVTKKPDSFIYVWFKNIHSKICPSIEFKE